MTEPKLFICNKANKYDFCEGCPSSIPHEEEFKGTDYACTIKNLHKCIIQVHPRKEIIVRCIPLKENK